MATLAHRSRAASGASPVSSNTVAELQELVGDLQRTLPGGSQSSSLETIQTQCDVLRRLRQLLVDANDLRQVKSTFRTSKGFRALLDTLRSASGFYNPSALSAAERTEFFEFLKTTLTVLSEALNEHGGNRRWFSSSSDNNGWNDLEEALRNTGINASSLELDTPDSQGQEQLFGTLIAFALGEESMTTIFRNIQAVFDSANGDPREHLIALFSGKERLQNPEALPIIINLWSMLFRPSTSDSLWPALSIVSCRNQLAAYDSGVLSQLLHAIFDQKLPSSEREIALKLAKRLVEYGTNELEDASYLYRLAGQSEEAATFLLEAIRSSRQPPFIQFDHSLHGYSSLELRDLARPFPPPSAGGYTLSTWVRFDQFDVDCHTTIFGIFDTAHTCCVLLYLEKATQYLILQTSTTPERPGVRFKTKIFDTDKWYHIAIVHRQAEGPGPSRVNFYLNGIFMEKAMSTYPNTPPLAPSATAATDGRISSLNAYARSTKIEAFLGTPEVYATRRGKDVVSTSFSIASFHLFHEALSDELVNIHRQLGPRYGGNFQDSLGSFLTYEASAEVNLFNETPHQDDKSDLISAMRNKASSVLPESRVAFSISPTSVMDDNDHNHINESRLMKSLSKNATKSLCYWTRSVGRAIAINAAVPSINSALCQRNGVAILQGDPVIAVPQSLDDASWRVGGCTAIGLKLIELANTKAALMTAVQIIFETIRANWRNSEAFEREHGYGILAGLLRDKMGLGSVFVKSTTGPIMDTDHDALAYELLQSILAFVGYQEDRPEESKIVNPLAYRALLIDLDLWRKTSTESQRLYYKQMRCFAKDSKHHVFNARRLTRMRIVKRLLEALKGETFNDEVFPYFLDAFRALLDCNSSPDVLRSTALFVTFSLQESRALVNRPLRSSSSVRQLRRPITPSMRPLSPLNPTSPSSRPRSSTLQGRNLSQSELGIRVLEIYADFLCDSTNAHAIRKFAKHVHHRWLVYLLVEHDVRVAVSSMRVLARLLVTQGPRYVAKFDKDGWFTVLRSNLKLWWKVPAIWISCFAILFGVDVGKIKLDQSFDPASLIATFQIHAGLNITYSDIFPALNGLLETGLRTVVKMQEDADSPIVARQENDGLPAENTTSTVKHARQRSMSLGTGLITQEPPKLPPRPQLNDFAAVLQTVVQFWDDLYTQSERFRDVAVSSSYVQDLLFVLYPVVVTSDTVSAETELNSRGSSLTFEGQDVMIRPHSATADQRSSIIRTTTIEAPRSPVAQKARPLRRGSSFILISSEREKYPAAATRLHTVLSPRKMAKVDLKVGNALVEALVELVDRVLKDQLLHRRDFQGFGLFLKVPPGFREYQAYFESYLLLHAMFSVAKDLKLNQRALLGETRVLQNLARYVMHMSDAVFEGWFMNGAEPLLDFIGALMELLSQPDVAKLKGVRLCSQAIATIRAVFFRVILLRLSELDDLNEEDDAVAFLQKMMYWQTIILSPENLEGNFLRLICYLLYTKLVSKDSRVRSAAADFWRMMLVQKPAEASMILNSNTPNNHRKLFAEFLKLTELDNETFLDWVDGHRGELDSFFYGAMSKTWEDFAAEENRKTDESSKNRIAKRKERLKQWQHDETNAERVLHRHENLTNVWQKNIHVSERLKHQRAMQDQQDGLTFLAANLERLDRSLHGPCALFEEDAPSKWRLDETEGRNRMRLRIVPDVTSRDDDSKRNRKDSDVPKTPLKVVTSVPHIAGPVSAGIAPTTTPTSGGPGETVTRERSASQSTMVSNGDDDFEMVADPNEGEDGFEDKHRRVMRSLHHGDQVQNVFNVSRIVGLDGCEGLLILGKDWLYLLDHFFARSDGEIVRVWQVSSEERDPYVQIASMRKPTDKKPRMVDGEQTNRHWKWAEVISISKRRFVFRDVAVEIFFTDGRSYLLTAMSTKERDELHKALLSKAPQVNSPSSALPAEDAWRLESLRTPDEAPTSLSTKWANVFNGFASNPATKKWIKGEISNFHYLMLVNTMAGRTFNDLTQYPVFPWVLADYTSDELDLDDPRTFRNLSKPMGCQNPEREVSWKKRYQDMIEMPDEIPFHYGTHYSTSSHVSSYLIRLQPFLQSYLIVQGRMDHAERLFHSIAKTWDSASGGTYNDVRELTPEFFYLPEFLTNINHYDFGCFQNSTQRVDHVELPPWAKGSPEIFIAKNREALESPYVSQHLHEWIDLVFGWKQRGEAAVEATNVFHHLSYHGAVNLDNVTDPFERETMIKFIHNFGQTPHQVFHRPHPTRGEIQKPTRLDRAADSLTKLPFAIIDTKERVASLIYNAKSNKVLCSAAFRLNIPPTFDKYMEWGFVDGSVRFYHSDTNKQVGLWEHLHQGQISCAVFADGKTLITAGTDCVVSFWDVVTGAKHVDLVPKVCFFGHKKAVTTLAVSRTFGTLLSASEDGDVFLWDLNRSEFVRQLVRVDEKGEKDRTAVHCARINNVNGHVMVCAGSKVSIYTLNGTLLVDQDVCDDTGDEEDVVHSCAFYEGVGNEWLEKELVFTGHRRGIVYVWDMRIRQDGGAGAGKWSLTLIKNLNHINSAREDGGNVDAAVTYILPMAQTVYTGDEDGKVVSWTIHPRKRPR
ncbi:beach-domain-containing protein [Saccharata proteae CBS 121410]|uniref:Beige protein homolog 1 n=1 Tax=Saccharata proteae CBS 121410 TaxID=1314787 RepID=A0A9P4LWD9_9PEZI|nr:beach-domain-containing protein [Saccharata proteae CBS 121410]